MVLRKIQEPPPTNPSYYVILAHGHVFSNHHGDENHMGCPISFAFKNLEFSLRKQKHEIICLTMTMGGNTKIFLFKNQWFFKNIEMSIPQSINPL
jgi:hypothetical protein